MSNPRRDYALLGVHISLARARENLQDALDKAKALGLAGRDVDDVKAALASVRRAEMRFNAKIKNGAA